MNPTTPLAEIRLRDVCILPDPTSKIYYMIGPARRGVCARMSHDLRFWTPAQPIFEVPDDIWGDIPVHGIWAPELHIYEGKYLLFLTFDTRHEFLEQWPNWRPRVTRGSTILVADAPLGPFRAFSQQSIPPADWMTLDGTLWIEDGVPHLIFCHEWVQITDGTIDFMPLKADLSAASGKSQVMFHGSEAPWNEKGQQYGCHVTDGPFPYRSDSGKLFLIWSGFSASGYTTGIAISDSGRLAGPWRQQNEPLYVHDGGHPMLFTTFEGQLMMVLHAPNEKTERPRLFEMEDTGETLVLGREFTA